MGGHQGQGSVDLYWIPLGAGGHFVGWNGRIFEALTAAHQHRSAQDLYHSALEVRLDQARFVTEMGPAWNMASGKGTSVCEGPVGTPLLGRFRIFRYQVRCWRDGVIPDAGEAVDSPQRLSSNYSAAVRLLRLLREVPALTWGRDELGCGDMWNSNSLTSWVLAGSGHDMSAIQTPLGGRAPGWEAGLALARRLAPIWSKPIDSAPLSKIPNQSAAWSMGQSQIPDVPDDRW